MKPIENLRLLAAEIVEEAKGGHPGSPMGLSHFMHILYTEYLVLDPNNTRNIDRDIFVLSNGHACLIQYIMNHLLGLIELEDLKGYRQLNSITPGHPEKNDHGIEIATGPLGQGVGASVGFAISSSLLAKHCRKTKTPNHIFCVFGDGCYQEGVSQEAFSLCSKLRLNNITFIYDYNRNTIDGPTELSMNEDVTARFKALDFTVLECRGYDSVGIRKALDLKSIRPKIIILLTDIAKDSGLEGNSKSHGAVLGAENIKALKERYNAPDEKFFLSDEVKKIYQRAKERMAKSIKIRNDNGINFEKYNEKYVNLINQNEQNLHPKYKTEYESKDDSTRKHFSAALNDIDTPQLLLSGCADLTTSVLSKIEKADDFETADGLDAFLRFGIREHAMCATMNGIAAHGIFVPICGTFLNFLTYGYPSVRLACLDRIKTIYVLSHDSILLGGDGPTHQPVEVLATIRATPGMVMLRPCDGRETRGALVQALIEKCPVAIILTRQIVGEIDETKMNIRGDSCKAGIEKGAYYLIKEEKHEMVIFATGSEVELALAARKVLKEYKVSVVSFVSFELFERQPEEYRRNVVDENVVKISIEALSEFGWQKYSDYQIGLCEYGRSAPGKDVYEFFGFTAENIAEKIRMFVDKHKGRILKRL